MEEMKNLKKLNVLIENESKEDFVIIFAEPSTQDLEKLLRGNCVLPLLADLLWISNKSLSGAKKEETNLERKGVEDWIKAWNSAQELKDVQFQTENREVIEEVVDNKEDIVVDDVKIEDVDEKLELDIEVKSELFDDNALSEDIDDPEISSFNGDNEKVIIRKAVVPKTKSSRKQATKKKPQKKDPQIVNVKAGEDLEQKGNHIQENRHTYISRNTPSPTQIDAEKENFNNIDEKDRQNNKDKTFPCDICGKIFAYTATLKVHKRIHTGEKPYSCDICGKTFYHTNLARHKLIHSGEKKFSCDVCGKFFTRSEDLSSHERIHTGEKPFKCAVCGKAFSHRSSLFQHNMIHTGEKKYSCDICGKLFSLKTAWTRHTERVHAGKKPFACDICEKTFYQKILLTYHMRNHTGEKPFSCEICGKAFSQNKCLARHKKIHSSEKPHSCDICQKTFKLRENLLRHNKSVAHLERINRKNKDSNFDDLSNDGEGEGENIKEEELTEKLFL